MLNKFIKGITRDRRTVEMLRFLTNNAYIRVVNYHNTDALNKDRFETEIKYFSENFHSVSLEDLDRFFETKEWPYDKPGLIPAIFEGYRSHYDTYAPILDRYEFTGWFYIPGFFMDVEEEKQIEFCKQQRLRISTVHGYDDGRIAMNEDEIKKLSEKHVICCHTGTHYEVNENTSDEELKFEIIESKKRIEKATGKSCDVFCWLSGEEYDHCKWAHSYLKEAGYKYIVSNLKIEKIK